MSAIIYICNKIEPLFSKACEYGIRAAIYIAGQSAQKRKVGLKEVAKEIDSPEAYTSKILQKLAKGGVVVSEKGPRGGFSIEQGKLQGLKLAVVVNAIDGDAIYKGCGLGLEECNASKPCPLHFKFKIVRDNLQDLLEKSSLIELSSQLDKGLGFLKQ